MVVTRGDSNVAMEAVGSRGWWRCSRFARSHGFSHHGWRSPMKWTTFVHDCPHGLFTDRGRLAPETALPFENVTAQT